MSISEEVKLEYDINKCMQFKDKDVSFQSHKIPYLNGYKYLVCFDFQKESEHYFFVAEIFLPIHKIYLFSLNFHPFQDGRDILNEVIPNIKANDYGAGFDFLDLYQNLKKFYDKYYPFINSKETFNTIGCYHLGKLYDYHLLIQSTDLFWREVKLIEEIKNKRKETKNICTISDEFLCLYEGEIQGENPKILLTFYASLRSLTSFKKSLTGNILTLLWREYNNKIYEMKLKSELEGIIDEIFDMIMEKIKGFGVKMDIQKYTEGEVPRIDIIKIENEISQLEYQMKLSGNILVFNKLHANYEKAIEYYSAINDNKYEMYIKKIQEMLKDEKYAKFYS